MLAAEGGIDSEISELRVSEILKDCFLKMEARKVGRRVFLIPPDFTRSHSFAGPITKMAYDHFKDRVSDVMPALGTHDASGNLPWSYLHCSVS